MYRPKSKHISVLGGGMPQISILKKTSFTIYFRIQSMDLLVLVAKPKNLWYSEFEWILFWRSLAAFQLFFVNSLQVKRYGRSLWFFTHYKVSETKITCFCAWLDNSQRWLPKAYDLTYEKSCAEHTYKMLNLKSD